MGFYFLLEPGLHHCFTLKELCAGSAIATTALKSDGNIASSASNFVPSLGSIPSQVVESSTGANSCLYGRNSLAVSIDNPSYVQS